MIKRKKSIRIRRDSTIDNYNNNRYTEVEQQEHINDETKINYKYQTKESSLENGKVNKNKRIFNSAEKSRKGLRSKTHNNYNRKITRVENKLNKENKEICCT